MIIHTQRNIRQIKRYIVKSGWGNEARFFDNFIGDIEQKGDLHGFLDCLENYSTIKLREIMENYKQYSTPYNPIDSKENAHFNNVHAIDSAMAGMK